MLLGRSIISWLIFAFVAVCIFIVFRWLIPLAFGLVGVDIPSQIATILALLIAVGIFGYPYWGRGRVA